MLLKINHRVLFPLLKDTKSMLAVCFTFGLTVFSFSQNYISGLVYNNGSAYSAAGLNNAGTFVNASGGNFYVTGNVSNSGTTAYDGGALVFAGSSAQSLNGSNTFYTSNVSFNNSAGVVLNKGLSVDNTATFVSGLVTTPTGSTEPLEFTSPALPSGVSDASHVNGYVRKLGAGSFSFPTGDATNSQTMVINATANASGIVVKYFTGDAGAAPFSSAGSSTLPLLYYNRLEYWTVLPVSTASGSVTIWWDSHNNQGIAAASDLRVAHLSGGQWLNEGTTGVGTAAAGSVTSNALSTWSVFTLGSISINSPLPITLTDFNAAVNNCQVSLTWTTAKEVNFNHYELQSSADGMDFTVLKKLSAKGDNSSYAYQYTPPTASMLYYRLKMTDTDGSVAYSKIVSMDAPCTEKGDITIYPVPTGGMLTIDANGQQLVSYSISDSQGSLIRTADLSGDSSQLDLGTEADGIYYLMVNSMNGDPKRIKIIKTH